MWRIPVGDAVTRAVLDRTRGTRCIGTFVCAHGAGGHMHDRSMVAIASVLTACGIEVVRFNFLYREQGSGRPDAMPRLQACMEAVVARVRTHASSPLLIVGGRSMGGRVASMIAAEGVDWDGLLLLAYPLHPAAHPEKLRDAHLPRIALPVLCFNGTRDALCGRELMERALTRVHTRWQMHWLEGADHAFHVLRSSGRSDSEVLHDVAQTTTAWLHTLLPHPPPLGGAGATPGLPHG